MLLVCLLASEHAYMALRWAVRVMLDSIPTKAELAVRRKEYGLKRGWLSKLNNALGAKKLETKRVTATGMPLTPTVGLSVAAVSGLTAAVAAAAIAIGSPRDEKEQLSLEVEGDRSSSEASPSREDLLENDLGAQAIRSMLKTH